MLTLRVGEDATVADWSTGAEDPVQRVRGKIQVRPTRSRVPTSSEPNLRADSALELSPQGHGAPTPEGATETAATATTSPARLRGLLTRRNQIKL